MLAQERIAEAHVMIGMMQTLGLSVEAVMFNLLMTAYKKRREWQLVIQVQTTVRQPQIAARLSVDRL